MKTSIKTRRLDALYKEVNYATNSRQREILSMFMAVAPHSTIKTVIEELNIEVE